MHAALAIDILMQPRLELQGSKPWHAKACWTFTLDHPRASDELEACARTLACEHNARLIMTRTMDGHPIYCIFSVNTSNHSHSFEEHHNPLRGASVVFAALNAWGCGPHSGFKTFGRDIGWTIPTLESHLTSCILDRTLGSLTPLTPSSRLEPRL